ncbi:MAG: hypothetical protein ACI4A5_02460 [Hominilimicola sp.]
MAFDIIVFSQEELESALNSGNTCIGLCDNTFALPRICNICYTAIGTVDVSVNITKEEFERMNIKCDGFEPHFTQEKVLPFSAPIQASPVSYRASVSSYLSSYFMSSYFMSSYLLTSYFMTRYTTSYMYEYEYEYETGSFASSYSTSFRSSISSFLSSFLTSFRSHADSAHTENMCIMVNGYGINLI